MKKRLVIIISILLVLLILGVGYYFSSPSYFVKAYFKAYAEKDCEKLYDLINNFEGEFTTYNYFNKVCSQNLEDIGEYKLEINEEYAVAQNDEMSLRVNYKKTGKKKFLIYDEYNIENNLVNVIKDVKLKLPINASEIKLDKINLIKYYVSSDDYEIYDEYVIDEMFETQYNLSAYYVEGHKNLSEAIEPSLTDNNFMIEFNNDKISIDLFTEDNCRFCNEELEFLDEFKKLYSDYFDVVQYDIKKHIFLFTRVKNYFDEDITGVPFLVVGDNYIEGYSEDYNKDIAQMIMNAYRSNDESILNNFK